MTSSELRIGDADRQEAVALLGEQYAEGRLTKDEYDERSDAVWSAKTRGDLSPVFADLPVRPAGPPRVEDGLRWAPMPGPGVVRRNGWHGVGRYVVPVLAVLIALTVLTHLPFVLFGLLVWFVVFRRPGAAHRHQVHGGRSHQWQPHR